MKVAFLTANKFQIELDKKHKGYTSKIIHKITSKPSKFINTMLVGNNIALVIYSFFMGDLLLNVLPLTYYNGFNVLLIQTS
ncbi:MAG TPA: CNNM domain-containing protein, partial [Flavobacteriaceae bacterium]|nr:CNNM domain-containing protein [Flavobacteriaceae bacterium]